MVVDLYLDSGYQAPVRRFPDCWGDPEEALLLLRVADHQDAGNRDLLLNDSVPPSLRYRTIPERLERKFHVLELFLCLAHRVQSLVIFYYEVLMYVQYYTVEPRYLANS